MKSKSFPPLALAAVVVLAIAAAILLVRSAILGPHSGPGVGSPSSVAASSPDLLLVKEGQPGIGLQAHRVVPATLAAVQGTPWIGFGHSFFAALSPDRSLLAGISWAGEAPTSASALHVFDLTTWKEAATALRLNGFAGLLTFRADNAGLYWVVPASGDPSAGYRLESCDLGSESSTLVMNLPAGLAPWEMRLLASGKLALVGVPTDANYVATGAPRLLLIDPERGELAGDVSLDGVAAGQTLAPATEAAEAEGQGRQVYPSFSPGFAWDLERSTLYAVDPDQDRVLVVDLDAGVIRARASIATPRSLLERTLAGFALPAEAKGGPLAVRRAAVDPEGRRLVVLSQQIQGGDIVSSHLRLIEVRGMREVRRLEGLISDFALSPDGSKLLVVRGEPEVRDGVAITAWHELLVLDAESFRTLARLKVSVADDLTVEGFSLDGRYGYLKGATARWVEGEGWRDWRSSWVVLDMTSLQPISTIEYDGSYGALLPLLP